MKILLIFGDKLYHYQKQILAGLLELKDLDISLLSCNDDIKIAKDSKFIRTVNKRFPIIKTDPYSFENANDFISVSTQTTVFQASFCYDYVLNFCESKVITDFKIKFRSILKPMLDVRNWYAASINKHADTTIKLEISSDNQNFIFFKSLSFSTETGTYNNRDKALYYFSYLVKSIFNENSFIVIKSETKDYTIYKSFLYHAKLLRIIFARKFSKVQFNWKVAVLENNVPQIITPEAGDFWADPFIVKELDNNWIFFEEFDRKTKSGKISVVNLKEKKTSQKETVLEKPHHLSFPNVFKFLDDYFMMPEESESDEQNIYKATQFPYRWEKHKTIFKNIKIVDPVFIYSEGRYWLFFNKIENFEYENNERLYLYSSPDLFSEEWESHPQNPVIIDKTKARNAGNITKQNGEFIRVSQNCKQTYGENVSKNKITELSEKIYREESLSSGWNFQTFHGFHTLNTAEDMTIIDLLIKEVK
ncbi:hypothetical protein IV494_08680 [Kaistella sp. G5-32]|uniref:Glucosamine inositolphosphorylceramide transferase 1 N-terminal domain-containing protein n=1 Tax=Kaistella gelatinilytica TaxID=2787636 RepID=A0ABS0FC08_9FLAO|nr:hypothetical protein [Kaistella gelatinilytica]MBF8457257.1 hypothetical protein [Kaistella gelatinilytica]